MKRDPRTIMIVGATSAIAQGAAAAFASEGASFFLVGRSPERLGTVAADLSARGAVRVEVLAVDPADVKGHEHAIAAGFAAFGSFDGLLIAHGTLPEQAACERDPSLAVDSLSVNATSVISFLLHI